MNDAGFRFDDVSRTFGDKPAVSSLSLCFRPHRHTAIIGPSGCGKTTLLRLLAGLDAPTSGRVLTDGRTASEAGRIAIPPHRRGVAMVFQDLALWPNLTVLDNVLLALAGAGLSRRDARTRAHDALGQCGVADLARRRPAQLSGGQQQRTALARAVAAHPRFLLLDEPFAGLDLVTRDQLLAQIRDLAAAAPMTVILVTHDPLEATALCEHTVVLENGAIAETGPFASLLRAPASELMKRFRQRHDEINAPRPI